MIEVTYLITRKKNKYIAELSMKFPSANWRDDMIDFSIDSKNLISNFDGFLFLIKVSFHKAEFALEFLW